MITGRGMWLAGLFIWVALSPAARAEAPPALTGHLVLAQARGDLNGDGLPDWAVAYQPKAGPGPRPLLVHWGRAGGGWGAPAHRAQGALLGADEGGTMGDPFVGLAIERGALVVRHQGGAGWGWSQLDRYARVGGELRLIGSTEEAFHRGAPEATRDLEDQNLNTRLVAWQRRDEGQPRAAGLFYELWAPPGAWGPPTRVLTRDFVRQGASRWRGPQDASVAVEARWEGEALRWRATVQDDAPLPGDRLEWVDGQGRPVTAPPPTRSPAPGGYRLEGRLLLGPLGLAKAQAEHRALSSGEQAQSHPLLGLGFRLRDEDPGEEAVVLASHSQEAHRGVLRLGCAAAPRLEDMRRSDFRWRSGDELLGER